MSWSLVALLKILKNDYFNVLKAKIFSQKLQLSHVNEGGVAAGLGALDSVFLVDDVNWDVCDWLTNS